MHVVFVCTGNICRSPMAEALARERHPAPGATFASAGTLGLGDRPMTAEAVQVLDEAGVPAKHHSSRKLDAGLVAGADLIYVMEPGHTSWIISRWPEAAGRVHLLDVEGRTIADPYGRPVHAYREARDRIGTALAARASEWTHPPTQR